MSVGDLVKFNPTFPPYEEFKVVAERAAIPYERGPLVLRLESVTTGRRLHDIPSSSTIPSGDTA